jgi:transcriptional regulator with XRE-family HTH domain
MRSIELDCPPIRICSDQWKLLNVNLCSAEELTAMPANRSKGIPKRRPRSSSPFGKLLIELMQEKHISVRQAAEAIGVGTSTIASWRSGALPEDFRAVRALSRTLGVSFSYLLTGEDDTRPEGAPAVAEVFSDGGTLFDGYAKITIQRLLPKKE